MGLRLTSLALALALVAVGLFAASPFLCDRLVGTGESFNYSLATADALQQMRGGTVPPMVGQGAYAFNGRIHPLRDAPYFFYLAAAIDLSTRHRLSLWEVQNASLAFSIIAASLACYLGLRRGAGCPPPLSFLLSATYGLSPALLGAAYSYDLFMTVHAAPFVALAVAACVRGCVRPSFSADAWLAAALAAAWLAHPPVALWLTGGVVAVRLAAFLRSPGWRALASGTCAVGLCAALASYVFVSVFTLNSDLSLLAGGDIYAGVSEAITQIVRSAFPASVLPVGPLANGVGDLQFGYASWLVLVLASVCLAWAAAGRVALGRGIGLAAGACLGYAALLLALVLPVPVLDPLLWRHMPHLVVALTNTWPMQRLYLVAVPFTLFSAALVLPAALASVRVPRAAVAAVVVACAAWSLHEARLFVARGDLNRWTTEATAAAFRPANLDVTVTSYAYFGIPPSFVYGVMDPAFEFRMLRGGTEEVDSPTASARRNSPVVDRGALRASTASFVTLEPGKRYLLTFAFRAAPTSGYLQLIGPLVQRNYSLPASGQKRGFGMLEGNRRSITVWTDGTVPERVGIRLVLPGADAPSDPQEVFSDYVLQEVRPGDLSIRLDSLVPLRFTVDAPESGCTVETPRCFIAGYAATANGTRVVPVMSPDRLVMVPVPPGRSSVELTYEGSPVLRRSFWFCAASWAAFILWRLSGSRAPALLGSPGDWPLVRCAPWAAAVACLLVAAAWGWHARERRSLESQVGPVQVDFALPYGQRGNRQALLATGHPAAGVVVNVACLDNSHVRLGADVWGQYFQSEPIEVDYSRIQSLVVSDSALFPASNPAVASLAPSERAALRGELRVELNGREAIRANCYAYETTQSEIQVGSSRFGSTAEGLFSGRILGSRRLPVPRDIPLPWGRRIHMVLRFPKGAVGSSEPLLSAHSGPKSCLCFVTYLAGSRIRLTCLGSDASRLQSAEIPCDPEASHRLDFAAGDAEEPVHGYRLGCDFDGAPVFDSSRLRSPGIPSVAVSGLDTGTAPGVLGRFTGPQMDVSTVAAPSAAGQVGRPGTVHMIVSFPPGKAGRSEPLLTTGRTGAGDMVYVTYADKGHVMIGFDHWGVGGEKSPPIAVDYSLPHEIWITLSSLGPAGAAGPKVEVLMDGGAVITSALTPYPTNPAEVTYVRNQIGGSTSDPEFSGSLHFVERVGGPSPKG